MFDFDPKVFEFHEGARRFELGTTANAAVHAASAGLDIVLEIGVDRLRKRTSEIVTDAVERLSDAGDLLKTPDSPRERAVIGAIQMRGPPEEGEPLRPDRDEATDLKESDGRGGVALREVRIFGHGRQGDRLIDGPGHANDRGNDEEDARDLR